MEQGCIKSDCDSIYNVTKNSTQNKCEQTLYYKPSMFWEKNVTMSTAEE